MVYHIFPNTSGEKMCQTLTALSWQRNNIGIAYLAVAKNTGFHRIFTVLCNFVQTFQRIWFSCKVQKVEDSFFNFSGAPKIARKVHVKHLHIDSQNIK